MSKVTSVYKGILLYSNVCWASQYSFLKWFVECYIESHLFLTLILGFRCDVDEIYGLLGCYTASCFNSHTTPCNNPEDRTFHLFLMNRKLYFKNYMICGFVDSWDLRSSGILHGVVWQLFMDVSGQRVGPIFTGQESE
jgi:hypothetical protein